MAKSLRSKWRRKMKAVKRDRYEKKETERLVNMLIKAGEYEVGPKIKDEPMEAPPTPDPTSIEATVTEPESAQPEAEKPETLEQKVLDVVERRIRARRSRSRKRATAIGELPEESDDEEVEEVDMQETPKEKVERVYSRKTKRDQFGNYPVWYSARKIQKQKKRNKRLHSKKLRFMKAKM